MSTLKKDRKRGSGELQAHHSHLSPQLQKSTDAVNWKGKGALEKAQTRWVTTNSQSWPKHTSRSVSSSASHSITITEQGPLEEVQALGQDHIGSSEEGWYLYD